MQKPEIFIKTISKSFTNHLHKNSFVPWSYFPIDNSRREKFLLDLYNTLIKGVYTPSFPRDYVVSNKHNFVARIVPSLTLPDYCVYYYCIKKIEDKIAYNRVENTFGGWTLGGLMRKSENDEMEKRKKDFSF